MRERHAQIPGTAKEARAMGLSVYFTGNPCPLGHIAPRRVINRGCAECHTLKQATKSRLRSKSDWLKQNKERAQAASRAWKARNSARVLAINAARRAMGQVPLSEFDKLFVTEIYDLARLLGKITGKQWHVDHVIPLKHPKVCGLHVPNNLRVVPAEINISKKNRFELESA